MHQINIIGVVGAGTMGQGIAQVCAQAGFRTILFDINASALTKAQNSINQNLDLGRQRGKLTEAQVEKTLANLKFTQDTLDLMVDLVIEAVVEKLEVKQGIFKELAAINNPDCILATNTSSISITKIAASLDNPGRVIGMHFFNPAPLMPLVEVVAGAATTPQTVQVVTDLIRKLNKTPVQLQDSPGFIVNRVARQYYLESLKMLEEQVTTHQTIDKLLEATGFKMGPFRLMDLIGNDVNFAVTCSLFKAFHYDTRFRPSRVQERKVEAGHLGRKSGKGFYDYS